MARLVKVLAAFLVYKVDTAEVLAENLQHLNRLESATEEEKINTLFALYEISFDGVKWPQPNATSEGNLTDMAEGLMRFVNNRINKNQVLATQP